MPLTACNTMRTTLHSVRLRQWVLPVRESKVLRWLYHAFVSIDSYGPSRFRTARADVIIAPDTRRLSDLIQGILTHTPAASRESIVPGIEAGRARRIA